MHRSRRKLRRHNLRRSASDAELLAGGFSQGVVDPVLPTRPALLEVLEDVTVDPQRDEFLRVRIREQRTRRLPTRDHTEELVGRLSRGRAGHHHLNARLRAILRHRDRPPEACGRVVGDAPDHQSETSLGSRFRGEHPSAARSETSVLRKSLMPVYATPDTGQVL